MKISRITAKTGPLASKGVKVVASAGRRVTQSSAQMLEWLKGQIKGLVDALKDGRLLAYLRGKLDEMLGVVRNSSGTGGFFKFKKVLSRKMIKQELPNSCGPACILKLAMDKGKKGLTEKAIREIAETTLEGTDKRGMIKSLKKKFGKENISFDMAYRKGISDVEMLREVSKNSKPWIAWIGPKPSPQKTHSVIVDKVIGEKVYIRDPWPLEAVDDITFKSSKSGVLGIVDIDVFAKQWANGYNYVFKIK